MDFHQIYRRYFPLKDLELIMFSLWQVSDTSCCHENAVMQTFGMEFLLAMAGYVFILVKVFHF